MNKLKKHIQSVRVDIFDVLVLGGAGCLVYGVAVIWGPWAWIVGGLMLLALGLFGAARKARMAGKM